MSLEEAASGTIGSHSWREMTWRVSPGIAARGSVLKPTAACADGPEGDGGLRMVAAAARACASGGAAARSEWVVGVSSRSCSTTVPAAICRGSAREECLCRSLGGGFGACAIAVASTSRTEATGERIGTARTATSLSSSAAARCRHVRGWCRASWACAGVGVVCAKERGRRVVSGCNEGLRRADRADGDVDSGCGGCNKEFQVAKLNEQCRASDGVTCAAAGV